MARFNRKSLARLAARIEAWNNITQKELLSGQGMKMNKPGSQNRKK